MDMFSYYSIYVKIRIVFYMEMKFFPNFEKVKGDVGPIIGYKMECVLPLMNGATSTIPSFIHTLLRALFHILWK